MDPSGRDRLIEIVGEAMRLRAPEREAFVRGACADEQVRAEAMSLLAALGPSSGFMDRPTISDGGERDARGSMREGPGALVGRYKLLQNIGEGGFGVVFMAEQREPVHRMVALKIIKLGMDTRAVVARFEQERQALALMDHPSIARVLDAGATETGRPYFVMELVRGDSIVEHCDKQRLGTRERLELFVQVCRAVQHAHTKGVIHRDLKPGNVLVTTVDGRPVPKVIDFGIAKATGGRLTDKTLFTEFRQLIGTPAYMSPEQADNTSADVDTRTDVYSLGVILYELLTGVTPFDPSKLQSATWAEMQRIIREVDPPRPSTRLSTMRATQEDVDARRSSEAGRSAALVKGDLDWIVMRCLEKDRARRYETAEALAADVGRHLRGEAVLAAPPSAVYRVRKFVRRHRVAVATGAAVGAALVLGMGAAVWQAGVARQQRDAAERSRKQTEQVAAFQASQLRDINVEEMGERLKAQLLSEAKAGLVRAGRSEPEIADAQARLASLLRDANMTSVAMRTLDENILSRALKAVDEQFGDQPLVKAQLLLTMSGTLMDLGLPEKAVAPAAEAVAIRRRELGDRDPATLDAIVGAANLAERRGDPVEGERLAREALDGYISVKGRECREACNAMSLVGLAMLGQGRAAEGEADLREAVGIMRRVCGPEDPELLQMLSNLAGALYDGGKPEAAEPLFREVMETNRRTLGDDHSSTILSINNLAIVLEGLQRTDEAVPLFREALERSRRTAGEDHPETLLYMSNLGFRLMEDGKLEEAELYMREALERRRRVLVEDHFSTLQSMHNLGRLLQAQGKLPEAEAMLRDALERRRRVHGPSHAWTLQSLSALGVVLRLEGKLDEAEPLYREALELRRSALGPEHPDTLESVNNMGVLLVSQGRFAAAEPLLREALAGREKKFGLENGAVCSTRVKLGECLTGLERFAEAELMLLEGERVAGKIGPPGRRTACVKSLVALYKAWEKAEPGKGYEQKAERWRADSTPAP